MARNSRRTHALPAFLLAALMALLLAACGADDESITGDAATVTQAQFVRQANSICSQTRQEILRDLNAWVKENGPAFRRAPGRQAAKDVALPLLETQLEELQQLGLPEGEGRDAETFLRSLERAIDRNRERELPLFHGRFVGNFDHSARLAKELGIGECALGASPETS